MNMFIYYVITRAIALMILGMILHDFVTKPNGVTPRDGENLGGLGLLIICPIIGDMFGFALLVILALASPVLLGYLFVAFIKKINLKMEKSRQRKERTESYLERLGKFGLGPKQIPAFVTSAEELKEYMQVMKEFEIIDAKELEEI